MPTVTEPSTGFDQYLSQSGSFVSIVGQEAIYQLSAVSWSARSFYRLLRLSFLGHPLGSGLAFLAKRASHKRWKDVTILCSSSSLLCWGASLFFPSFMGMGLGTQRKPLLFSQLIPLTTQ